MDKLKLMELLQRFGIEYEKSDTYIILREGFEKVVGYSQFYVSFEFDAKGKFIEVGIYE